MSESASGATPPTPPVTPPVATPPVVTPPVVTEPVAPQKPAPAVVEATPAPAPATALTAAAQAAAQQARQQQQQISILTEQLETFTVQSNTPHPNDKAFQACAQLLTAVLISITNQPNPAAMTVVWNFFVANKSVPPAPSILDDNRALRGIEAVNKTQRAKVELIYTLFRKAVTGIDVANSKLVAQLPLQQTVKCPALITFLSAQAKIVAAQAAKTKST